MKDGATVAVVGAGGNIGSHTVSHVARLPGIARLVLVDRDRYEPHNLINQNIDASAVGRPKAEVQARRARRIRPGLHVTAIGADIEDLPIGRLRADAVLACVDSRRARQYLNEIMWRLGVPWIDAGVLSEGSLARVTWYRPAEGAQCLECGWDETDYRSIEQTYPCNTGIAPATGGSAALGGLAASVQVLECLKLLAENEPAQASGGEVVIDAAHHLIYRTKPRQNPDCRFDHAIWPIEPLNATTQLRLDQLMDVADDDSAPARTLRVAGSRVVHRLTCTGCGSSRTVLRLASRLTGSDRRCRRCRAPVVVCGHALTEGIARHDASRAALRRPVARLGVASGDVVELSGPSGPRYYEFPTAPCRSSSTEEATA